jgi:uncharacterized paraquat-inducible protein A
MSPIRAANLALLIAFPIAWAAPLLRAGLLPFFDLGTISVLSGIGVLWETDVFLALIVTLFALIAPIAKVVGLEMILTERAPPTLLPILTTLGKFAMADVFLIALYIVLAKGVGVGRVETGWGLYLFTACALVSLILSFATKRRL